MFAFLNEHAAPYSEMGTSRQATVEIIYRDDVPRPFQEVLILKSSERESGVSSGTLTAVCIMFLNDPEVLVMRAQEKFDASGRLADETTRGIIRDLLVGLADWTRRLQGESDR